MEHCRNIELRFAGSSANVLETPFPGRLCSSISPWPFLSDISFLFSSVCRGSGTGASFQAGSSSGLVIRWAKDLPTGPNSKSPRVKNVSGCVGLAREVKKRTRIHEPVDVLVVFPLDGFLQVARLRHDGFAAERRTVRSEV